MIFSWKTVGENDNREPVINITDTETSNEIPTKEDLNKPFSKKEFAKAVRNLNTTKSKG